MMSVELGEFGVWARWGDITPELAGDAEQLGYGAIWLGGSPGGDLGPVEEVLQRTERIPVATGIVNMWREEARDIAVAYHRIEERHPGRFVLGLGIGHPEATREYQKPYATMVDYLDDLDEAGVSRDRRLLAALGPRVLRLSAERTMGAHPYLTTPIHTAEARRIMGEGPLLAPEQTIVYDDDPGQARELGREFVARYVRMVNYRENLKREGWSDEDIAGVTDRLVDSLAIHGDIEVIAAGLRAHLDAGADHVGIQVLGDNKREALRDLAGLLIH